MEPFEIAKIALDAVNTMKGEEPALFDVGAYVGYTDYILIASGKSGRQLKSMADEIEKRVGELGEPIIGTEGKDQGNWVLIDFGFLVVHLFKSDVRDYYQMDSLWSKYLIS